MDIFDGASESTKASTTEVPNMTSRKKTNAQRCREYRERKKLQNTMVQNITAERSDECSETDQLQANAERRKKHYEAQKLQKKQKNKKYYNRKKTIQALNSLYHHSDAESTKASTTGVQTITSRKKTKKTNAQTCREYRERKKLQNTIVQNITAERSDECSETDQLQANAERRKKQCEAQKLKRKQKNKKYYDKKKKLQALNTLNHHSDAFPSNSAIRQKWIAATGLKKVDPNKSIKICCLQKQHEIRTGKMTTLHHNAFPVLMMSTPDIDFTQDQRSLFHTQDDYLDDKDYIKLEPFTPHDEIDIKPESFTQHDKIDIKLEPFTSHDEIDIKPESFTQHDKIDIKLEPFTPHDEIDIKPESSTQHDKVDIKLEPFTPHDEIDIKSESFTQHDKIDIKLEPFTP